MPLPFAPPPSQSKIYQDLKNLKLSEVTADQFDSLKTALFTQGVDSSEDEMRRLNLVGQASNQQSASGPIPGTAKLIEVDSEDAGLHDFFIPEEGEVWQCIGAATGTVVNSTVIIMLRDTDNQRLELGQETSVNVTFNPTFGADLLIDENVWLTVDFSGNSPPGTKALAAFIRVR